MYALLNIRSSRVEEQYIRSHGGAALIDPKVVSGRVTCPADRRSARIRVDVLTEPTPFCVISERGGEAFVVLARRGGVYTVVYSLVRAY